MYDPKKNVGESASRELSALHSHPDKDNTPESFQVIESKVFNE